MTLPILLLLGTVLVALVLFALEIIPTDVTALGILIFLIVARLLPIERAFELKLDGKLSMRLLLIVVSSSSVTLSSRILRIFCRWSSRFPCEKLSRKTSVPASIIAAMLSADSVAGPSVHTILVLRRRMVPS